MVSLLHVVVTVLWYQSIEAARILLLLYPSGSHVSYMTAAVEGLTQHQVYMLYPPSLPAPPTLNTTGIQLITYTNSQPDFFQLPREKQSDMLRELIGMSPEDTTRAHGKYFLPLCTNALEDKKLWMELQSLQFDLAIIDGFVFTRCMYIIAYKLHIPYITISSMYEPWLYAAPAMPSFVPFQLMRYPFSDKMSLWERFKNLHKYVTTIMIPDPVTESDDLVHQYASEMPTKSVRQLAKESKLWFLNSDILLDYARPSMPNMVDTGGLTTGPARPLRPDLETFINSNSKGTIIVSMGMTSLMFSDHQEKQLLDAFASLPYNIIWRYLGRPKSVPANLKLLPWLPQNDLLGHKNVRLFITHCGNNGQFEALYHGVPMLGIPLFADQFYNCHRMQYKKYGITIDIDHLDTKRITDTINKLINEPLYRENIQRSSKMYRERGKTARQVTAYWINFVLTYGASHLESYATKLPWYQYALIDVFMLVFTVIVVILLLILLICKCVFRCLCKKDPKVKTN